MGSVAPYQLLKMTITCIEGTNLSQNPTQIYVSSYAGSLFNSGKHYAEAVAPPHL